MKNTREGGVIIQVDALCDELYLSCEKILRTNQPFGVSMNDQLGSRYTVVESLTADQIPQLHSLIQQQWWGGKRTLEDVELMVKHTSLMIGLIDRSTDRLVGYCRVLTDFAFRATIYDVMVTSELKGEGLGRYLMDVLCAHPKLQRVSFIYLACEPDLYSFYQQWGFKTYEGRAQWMIKVQREE